MAQNPLHTLAQLKKEKRYGRMAELFARSTADEAAVVLIRRAIQAGPPERNGKAG
jgi:hypothetical protein